MQQNELSQRDLAKELGCDGSYPAYFLRADRAPGLRFAVRIEELTSSWPEGPIRVADWVPVDHSPTVAPAAVGGE